MNPIILHGDIDREVAGEIFRARKVSIDIETTGLDWRNDQIQTVQLALQPEAVFIVQDPARRPANLIAILDAKSIRKIFHHAMFDLRFMVSAWQCRPVNAVCTKIASKILDPNTKDHSLKRLLAKHLGVQIEKAARLSDWSSSILSVEQVEYAANDVIYLAELFQILQQALERKNLWWLAENCFTHLPGRVALEIMNYGDVFTY